eukprot:CAMPEP_0202443516 /NCGR_PEP_ID=MMETSP1360-20130828/2745_1 /ASSEMBLY_ACC=CAM_ASM_000848 /TAXON_ID=515479 /ORGANISM="Licmophora paradoxa, Strain CCMP2313" /LENGTH=361 /DNA_ID=CAMNT_0049059213 /DNA_START=22 /DNA_END=1107 /DNA_ORIENTATION=-
MADDKQKEYCVNFENVKEAASRIEGVVRRTPVLTSPLFDDDDSIISSNGNKKRFYFKVEAMQHTGSFKFRGALNATKCEVAKNGNTDSSPLHVVTHSSGNHAQAVAMAAKLSSTPERPVKATIVMPRNAPVIKKTATEASGAKVILVDSTNEAREAEADKIVEETDAVFIHPSEDPRVIAGQGTCSLEMVEQVKELGCEKLDAVIIPVGGGGLASGNTIALRGLLGDQVKIILAEPSKLDDAKRSFDAKELLGHKPDNKLDSVADGLKTTLGPNTWPIVRDLVDDIFTVSEEDILRNTKRVWEQLKVCIEPSAGVGVAVAMGEEFHQKYRAEDGIRNVGVILCGGNVDILKTANKMETIGL